MPLQAANKKIKMEVDSFKGVTTNLRVQTAPGVWLDIDIWTTSDNSVSIEVCPDENQKVLFNGIDQHGCALDMHRSGEFEAYIKG